MLPERKSPKASSKPCVSFSTTFFPNGITVRHPEIGKLFRRGSLITVFLGLGVFGANSSIRESSTFNQVFYTRRIRKLGYLSEPMYAYALAVFAWLRGE